MRPNREQIGARLRFDVLRRCNFSCYYCGVPASLGTRQLHVDHVVPVVLGGTNDPWNLVAACWDCNLGKAHTAPSEDLIRQVRNDYCAYVSPYVAGVGQCLYCGIPVVVDEGDDFYDQCDNCNDLMCSSFDAGYKRAREVTL